MAPRSSRWLAHMRVWVAVAIVAGAATSVAAQRADARDSVTADSTSRTRRPLAPITVRAPMARAVAPPVATIDVPPARLVSYAAQATSSYDLVRRAAGVEIHEHGQGPGFTGNVVVRGFTSDHSADVLLSIDGVPINLPMHGHVEGYADWNLLLPIGVSSMRLISGPASPLYGDFALGGVMEVFTAADAAGTAAALSGSNVGDM
ncbi:MAG: TonB-dependent receptor plug domain-containing protein, partial [Gemmatimonadaceae bacterium]|nr:TonB-dependent receptor plug domain-containing protein [Gemmatimonadaceae bacterium]